MILSYFSIGNAYEQKGQHAAAIEAYEKGIALAGPQHFSKPSSAMCKASSTNGQSY